MGGAGVNPLLTWGGPGGRQARHDVVLSRGHFLYFRWARYQRMWTPKTKICLDPHMELVTVSMGLVQNRGVVLQSEWPVVSSLGEAMFLKLSGRSSCFPDNTQNCLARGTAV